MPEPRASQGVRNLRPRRAGTGADDLPESGAGADQLEGSLGGNTLVLENVAATAGLTAALKPDGTTQEIGQATGTP